MYWGTLEGHSKGQRLDPAYLHQKERHDRLVMSFFLGSGGLWPPLPFIISMLRAAKPPFRRGFACGKTLERRKGGAAQKGRPLGKL